MAPTLVDVLLPWIGVTGLPNLPRLLVAIPTGVVAALFLATGIADLFSSDSNPLRSDTYVQPTRVLEELDG